MNHEIAMNDFELIIQYELIITDFDDLSTYIYDVFLEYFRRLCDNHQCLYFSHNTPSIL